LARAEHPVRSEVRCAAGFAAARLLLPSSGERPLPPRTNRYIGPVVGTFEPYGLNLRRSREPTRNQL